MGIESVVVGHLIYPPKKLPDGDLSIGQVLVKNENTKTISVENILQMPVTVPPGTYRIKVDVRPKGKDKVTNQPKPGFSMWYISDEKIGQ
jgi:hypothetical protein